MKEDDGMGDFLVGEVDKEPQPRQLAIAFAQQVLMRISDLGREGSYKTFESDIDRYLVDYIDQGGLRTSATQFITRVSLRVAESLRQEQDPTAMGQDLKLLSRSFLITVENLTTVPQ